MNEFIIATTGSLIPLAFRTMGIALMSCLLTSLANARATVHVSADAVIASSVEVEFVHWERRSVVLRLQVPCLARLPAGVYGLRRVGTDYTYGPVRLQDDTSLDVPLGGMRLSAPTGAAEVVYHLLDPERGANAGRLHTDGGLVPLFPGRYDLVRDLSETSTAVEVLPGTITALACGAVSVVAPRTSADGAYYIVLDPAPDGNRLPKVAAYSTLSAAPQPVLPGNYRVLSADSAVPSDVLEVRAGRTTTLRCAALKVAPLTKSHDYVAYRTADRLPLLRARSDQRARFIVPGEYGLMRVANTGAATVTSFIAHAGRVTTMWIAADGSFAGSTGVVPVEVTTLPGRTLIPGRPFPITVRLAERCSVKLNVVSLDDDTSTSLPLLTRFDGRPPQATVEPVLPENLADGSTVVIEAVVTLAGGAELRGRCAALRVARPHVGVPGQLNAQANAATVVELRWSPVTDAAGYRVYRIGNHRPIHGDLLITDATFLDIGLSAGRLYRYRVCAVDQNGLEGPNARTEVTTPSH